MDDNLCDEIFERVKWPDRRDLCLKHPSILADLRKNWLHCYELDGKRPLHMPKIIHMMALSAFYQMNGYRITEPKANRMMVQDSMAIEKTLAMYRLVHRIKEQRSDGWGLSL
ncbi:MAG: hypothetical protein KGJ06_04555 [Pseudomonadota bacterium]|nr:hypothetical protein [Pseudomonadota bacterium]